MRVQGRSKLRMTCSEDLPTRGEQREQCATAPRNGSVGCQKAATKRVESGCKAPACVGRPTSEEHQHMRRRLQGPPNVLT